MNEKISFHKDTMETLLIKPRRHSDHRGFFAKLIVEKAYLK